MGVIVDTSELIHIERSAEIDDDTIRQRLPADSRIAAITISELMVGVLMADSERRRNRRLAFVDNVRRRLLVLPFGEDEAIQHARLLVSLRRAGTPIGERDLQIAATAIAGEHSVVTRNLAEFSVIPGLSVASLGST